MELFKTISNIRTYTTVFGAWKGFQIYQKIKSNKTDSISLNDISQPFKLRCGTSDINIFQQIFIYKEYDINLGFNPEIIIDAGGNIGLTAIFFANKYPESTIISIEPEQSNYNLLKENTKNYNNIITLNNALSHVSDQYLKVVDNARGKWGFTTESITNGEHENPNCLVKTITIDSIMNQYNYKTLDIVKIDIEGYEKELFEVNPDKWLPNTRCLIIELHDRIKTGCSKSFFSSISKYDFSFFYRGDNLIFINNEKLLANQKRKQLNHSLNKKLFSIVR